MTYKASNNLRDFLLSQPETGMGYQVLSPSLKSLNSNDLVIALNSQFVCTGLDKEVNVLETKRIDYNDIKDYSVLVSTQVSAFFESSRKERELAAVDNPLRESRGNDQEIFLRLSAFKDDLRIDRTNKCLLPGSYTTTVEDFILLKVESLMVSKLTNDPVVRYALPSNLDIKWIFEIFPKKGDQYRKGKVQPAFGKIGEGIECLFDNGTSPNTLVTDGAFLTNASS